MTRHHTTLRFNAETKTFEQVDIPFTPEEEALRDAQELAASIDAPKKLIREQITALELSVTERMRREALLGKTDTNPQTGKTAKQQIQAIDDQIAALCAQL